VAPRGSSIHCHGCNGCNGCNNCNGRNRGNSCNSRNGCNGRNGRAYATAVITLSVDDAVTSTGTVGVFAVLSFLLASSAFCATVALTSLK